MTRVREKKVQPSVRQRISVFLRLTITVVLLVYVVRQIDVSEAFRLLRDSDIRIFTMTVLVYVASKFLGAYRWYVLVRCGDANASLLSLIRFTFLGSFLQIFLPGGGGEIVRIAVLKQSGLNLTLSFSSVLLDRLLGFGALGVMLLLASPSISALGLPNGADAVAIGIAFFFIGSFLIIHPAIHNLILRLTPELSRWRRAAVSLIDTVNDYKSNQRALLWAVMLAFLMQFVRVAFFYFGFLALQIPVSIGSLLVLVPAFVLLTSLPISIGGVGVREVLFLTYFSAAGIQTDAAIALALLLYIANLLASMPGAWFALQLKLSATADYARSAG
jgi:uncharacterized protein (TIRG00374 family)